MKSKSRALAFACATLFSIQGIAFAAGSQQTLDTTRYSDPKCFSAAVIVLALEALSGRGALSSAESTSYESADVSFAIDATSEEIRFDGHTLTSAAPRDTTKPVACTWPGFSAPSSVSFLALDALNAVIAYRRANPWPYVPVDLAAPGASVTLVGYKPAVLVNLNQPARVLGCGVTETYRVDFPDAIVRPYDSCLDVRQTKLPAWDDLPHI